MAKKLYTALPSYINFDDISELINLFELEKDEFEVTWNSGGGSTAAGQMLVAYLNTTDKNINADVAGLAASMGAMVLPAFNKTKGANQADIMIHSVAGGEESTQKHTNKLLYDLWANKIDLVKFKEVTGLELKEVLFNDKREDVWITGKQAKYIGLFDESYDLSKVAEIKNKFDLSKLDYDLPENIKEKYNLKTNTVTKTNEMDIKDLKKAELQVGNPSVYNAIIEDGKTAEKLAEKERIAEIKKYAKYDIDYALDLIEKGAKLEIKDVEHFMEKKFDKKKVAELEEGSEGDLTPAQKLAKEKVTEEKQVEIDEKSNILAHAGFEIDKK